MWKQGFRGELENIREAVKGHDPHRVSEAEILAEPPLDPSLPWHHEQRVVPKVPDNREDPPLRLRKVIDD